MQARWLAIMEMGAWRRRDEYRAEPRSIAGAGSCFSGISVNIWKRPMHYHQAKLPRLKQSVSHTPCKKRPIFSALIISASIA